MVACLRVADLIVVNPFAYKLRLSLISIITTSSDALDSIETIVLCCFFLYWAEILSQFVTEIDG